MAVRTAKKILHRPDLSIERKHQGVVCGIDEVGRGPLAGPVVAACVYIPTDIYEYPFLQHVNDSKKISENRREDIFLHIREYCPYGIGRATHEEIDTLNIHHATLLAMRRAWQRMISDYRVKPVLALVDGKFTPSLSCNATAITKGDTVSVSIAAASIMAKVTRDRIMQQLHDEFPHYGWSKNAGYGTPEHIEGIMTHGVTPYHRRSFRPVRESLGLDAK